MRTANESPAGALVTTAPQFAALGVPNNFLTAPAARVANHPARILAQIALHRVLGNKSAVAATKFSMGTEDPKRN